MTITHPKRINIWISRALIALVLAVGLCATGLVVGYNRSVNLKHAVSDRSANLKQIQAENAQLKNSIFALVNNDQLSVLAQSHNLVLDKNPYYLPVNAQWSLALQ